MKEKPEEVFNRLRVSIDQATAQGIRLITHAYLDYRAGKVVGCCALGSVVLDFDKENELTAGELAEFRLGITKYEAAGIAAGFDDKSYIGGDVWTELGRRLRRHAEDHGHNLIPWGSLNPEFRPSP